MAYPAKHCGARWKLGRRCLLGGGASLVLPVMMPWRRAAAMSEAMAAETASENMLLVGGPAGGKLAHWANLLCPLLGPALAAGGILNWITVGAADGVTAANQFETQVSPDGTTAMLLPGSAAIAQLVGDPRARFDPAAWVAGLAGVSSTLIVGRVPLAEMAGGAPLRVLASDPTGSDLPTLLGLSLLGYDVKPVNPVTSIDDASIAAMRGDIDVATISNAGSGDLTHWQQSGLAPLFTLGALDDTGTAILDPTFPALPSLENLLIAKGVDGTKPLPTAWRALAVAKQLALGLVLPQLTPADRVAQWSRACADSIASIAIQAIAAAESLRLTTQPTAAAIISSITAPPDAQLELHEWLANRLGWRPT